MNDKKNRTTSTIAVNKRARFDFELSEKFEAGLVLEGWEVKAIRSGNVQLTDSYVLLRDGEAWLLGANIMPLTSASTAPLVAGSRSSALTPPSPDSLTATARSSSPVYCWPV